MVGMVFSAFLALRNKRGECSLNFLTTDRAPSTSVGLHTDSLDAPKSRCKEAMSTKFFADVIKCRHCGGREIEVRTKLHSEALVRCCRCGAMLWTWRELLFLIEPQPVTNVQAAVKGGRFQSTVGDMSPPRPLRAVGERHRR